MSNIRYRVHISRIGWEQGELADGMAAGTTGHAVQLEAIKITHAIVPIQYRAHVANIGWMDWVDVGQVAGTTGQARRLEAVQFRFKEPRQDAAIVGRAHVSRIGWMEPSSGETPDYFGTTGRGLQMEALQLFLLTKGDVANFNSNDSNLIAVPVSATLLEASKEIVKVAANTKACMDSCNRFVSALESGSKYGAMSHGVMTVVTCGRPAVQALSEMFAPNSDVNGDGASDREHIRPDYDRSLPLGAGDLPVGRSENIA